MHETLLPAPGSLLQSSQNRRCHTNVASNAPRRDETSMLLMIAVAYGKSSPSGSCKLLLRRHLFWVLYLWWHILWRVLLNVIRLSALLIRFHRWLIALLI